MKHTAPRVFSPKTEFEPLMYQAVLPLATDSSVVLNEFLANNTESITDSQDEHDDWIELHNISADIVDFSGMYLSDSQANVRKWQFPR